VTGEWIGLGAERLGLAGKGRVGDFLRVCDRHADAGEQLMTQRQDSMRMEGGRNMANHRIFYDFTFSPAKTGSY
jgi:TrwC relaxase